MSFFHGARAEKQETALSTPVVAASGVTFITGTAPVHTTDGKSNTVIMANNYQEAVAALGYNDDWKKYTLCEAIYTFFKLYSIAPVFFVNVLDPATHKTVVAAKEYEITDKQIKLPYEAIKSTVKVTGDYTEGTDYELFYDSSYLILELLEGGTVPTETKQLSIGFDAIDPLAVVDNDIIGGYDSATKKTTGLELIDAVFPKYRIVPDIIIAPGYSHKSVIAAVMDAKAEKINGVFGNACVITDADTNTVKDYRDVPEWKTKNNISSSKQILCWPGVKLGDYTFHLSTQLAALMGQVDAQNGCPCESPSNKNLQIDSAVAGDGTEILLDLTQANFLNANGIVTALNFIGGYVAWGNTTACYPANTDVAEYFTCVYRMFEWVSTTIIQTFWTKIDGAFRKRLIENILDSINIWLNGLMSSEKILGGRVEFLTDDNPTTELIAGKATFRIYLTPTSPMQEVLYILTYDASYAEEKLTV